MFPPIRKLFWQRLCHVKLQPRKPDYERLADPMQHADDLFCCLPERVVSKFGHHGNQKLRVEFGFLDLDLHIEVLHEGREPERGREGRYTGTTKWRGRGPAGPSAVGRACHVTCVA